MGCSVFITKRDIANRQSLAVKTDFIQQVLDALDRGDAAGVKALLKPIHAADVAQCKATSLIVGPGETMVLTVKVVRGEEEEALTPNTKLIPGKRFAIVVEEDGKVTTSVEDR